MSDDGILFLVLAPALIGVAALLVGIRVLSGPKRGKTNSTGENVFGVICLVVAFGIGACYAVMLFAGMVN